MEGFEGMEGTPEVSIVPLIIAMVVGLLFAALMVASFWKVFTKAGQPGWAAIVPIYNIFVLVQISGKPVWYIALFFVPIANMIAPILIGLGVAERFGKSAGFGVGLGLVPFICYPLLAFSDDQYRG